MSRDEQLEELIHFYALGTLSQEERARVEAYLTEQPEARARLEAVMRTVEELPYAATPLEPSERVRARLLKRIKDDVRAQRESAADSHPAESFWDRLRAGLSGARATGALALTAVLLALVSTVWAVSLRGQVLELQAENSALRREILAQNEVIAQITDPQSRTVVVSGTDLQPLAGGQLIANPGEQQAVLVLNGLPPLPAGLVYQIWLIRGDQPASAGLFTVDADGAVVVLVRGDAPLESFNAVGVSVEPAGGSELPTGDIVILAEISF